MESWIPAAVILGALVLFGGYLALVLRGAGDEFRAPRPSPPPRLPPTGRPPAAPLPRIRPPEGAVAAGTTALGSRSGGSDPETEAAGLVRVLESGPDVQRQAAAKALSLPFAGTCNPRVAEALARVVHAEDTTTSVRAEAWIALRAVMGEELSWEEEVRARHAFPEGLDEAWLDAILG